MGGMHGFGPVRTPDGGLTYHEPWELRPLAIACLIGSGPWRPTIEGLAPADYLGSSYYVRWLRAAEHKLVEQGYLTPDELARWMATLGESPDADVPTSSDPETVGAIRAGFEPFVHTDVTSSAFAVGEPVRVRRMRLEAHHRCPRYVRGVVGEVERVCGAAPAPESADDLECVYTVRFASVDVFGDRSGDGEPPYVLLIDLWERYLEAP